MQEGFVNSMNKQCAMYCIDLIRAVMQEKVVPELPSDVILEELYSVAKLHAVEALVFHGLEQLNIDENNPVWQNWRNRADLLLTQSIVQLAERDRLFAALPAGGIPILPVKGCWLKEQYPDIDYRQMSDLDILIHPEDTENAKMILLQRGYQEQHGASTHHDEYSKPPYMGVELHTSLLPVEDERYTYYQNVWSKAIPAEDIPGVYRLKPEDEYIFFLVHLYKHVYYAGTGIRPFLDCLVYRKLWPDMDQNYLQREYHALGLGSFAAQVEQLSDCWFETGDEIPYSLAKIAQSVMSSSVYGTANEEFQLNMEKMYEKYHSRFIAHLAYWLYRLFAPLEEMEPQYPILGTYPWLLPVYWVVHLVQKVTREPKELLQHFKKVNEAGEKYGEGKAGWNPDSNE